MILSINYCWESFQNSSRHASLKSSRNSLQNFSTDSCRNFVQGLFKKNCPGFFPKISFGVLHLSLLYGLLHANFLGISLSALSRAFSEIPSLMFNDLFGIGDFFEIFLGAFRNSSMWGMLPGNLLEISLGTLSVSSFRYISENSQEISPEICARIFLKFFQRLSNCFQSFLNIDRFYVDFFGVALGNFSQNSSRDSFRNSD